MDARYAVKHHQNYRQQDEEDQSQVKGSAGRGIRFKNDTVDSFPDMVTL
jgi:hypothetical protein